MTDDRSALARGWAAFCGWRLRVIEWRYRSYRPDSWLGQIPWLAVGAVALVAAAAWIRYRIDWVTMVGFLTTPLSFYLAGRNIQNLSNRKVILDSHERCMEAHRMAHDAIERFAEGMAAYRRLYTRHYAMTGEAYRDDPSVDAPEQHDA